MTELKTIDTDNVEEMAKLIAQFADAKKAKDIIGIDLRGVAPVADYFLVMHGNNRPQIKAIADNIEHELMEYGVKVFAISGYSDAEWILLDYGNIIIHVFAEDQREYFNIEALWADAKISKFEPVEG